MKLDKNYGYRIVADNMQEGIQVLQKFWNSPSVFFDGDYFKVNGGTLAKTNTPIPITVAAKSEKMMGIAANTRMYGKRLISRLKNSNSNLRNSRGFPIMS